MPALPQGEPNKEIYYMNEQFSRTEALIGTEALEKIKRSRVLIFGIGGVGSYTAESLARAGVGHLTLVDGDTVAPSNLNRQLYALHSTIGILKVEAAKARIMDINPDADVLSLPIFYSAENASSIDFSNYDYIVDAIDTVSSKLLIICQAKSLGVPVISSMGTGNKLNPADFEITDVYKTSVCPLARVMRRELKARGVKSLKVLYSKEEPKSVSGGRTPASISFTPSVAGLIIASEVIKDIIN